MSRPATDDDVADLPLWSWTEERYLKTSDGQKLPRRGSVKQACAILDGCGRDEVYDLIAAGLVQAYKLRPDRPNSHWKLDLLSVWRHKKQQESRGQ